MAEMYNTAGNLVPLGREGTGAATVLSPNVLPLIQQFRNEQIKQKQLEATKQYQREQLALKAAQQQKEKEFIPEAFAAPESGYFTPLVEQQQKQVIDSYKEWLKANPNASMADKTMAFQDANRKVQGLNSYNKFQTEQLQKTLPELQKYYNTNESDAFRYVTSRPGLSEAPVVEFQETIRSNPDRFRWRDVGANLFKPLGNNKYSYTDNLGRTVEVDKNQLFETEEVEDPIVGVKVPVSKLNYSKAAAVAFADPEVRNALGRNAEKALQIINSDPQYANATKEQKEDLAVKDGLDKLFEGMGGVAYKRDIQTEIDKAAQKAKGEKLAEVEKFIVPITESFVIKDVNGRNVQNAVVNLGNARVVTLQKPIPVQAGATGTILSGNEKTLETLAKKGYITPLSDGTYRLNFGFNVNSAKRPISAYMSAKPFPINHATGKRMIPANTLLSPGQVKYFMGKGRTDMIRKVDDYIVSPETFRVNSEDEELIGPQIRSLKIMIPATRVPEIKAADKEPKQGPQGW